MKRTELQSCCMCGHGLMYHGTSLFYGITLRHYGFDMGAVRRRAGMEDMMGGGRPGATLAQVLGPDEDIAQELAQPKTLLVCQKCMIDNFLSIIEADPKPT